jgi:hypothetical protein
MVEADELCDRVAIINQGRVLACDSPSSLKRNLQQEAIFHLKVSSFNGSLNAGIFESLPGVCNAIHRPQDGFDSLDLILEEEQALTGVVNTLNTANIRLLNLQKNEPTLEDVFVKLVGQSMDQVEQKGALMNNNPSPTAQLLPAEMAPVLWGCACKNSSLTVRQTVIARSYPLVGQMRDVLDVFDPASAIVRLYLCIRVRVFTL